MIRLGSAARWPRTSPYWHAELEHVVPVVHARLHPPQFAGSLVVSTQLVPQQSPE
jgi:hypothetical protein